MDYWNRWRAARDDFNRDFIFALIDFYPEGDRWLFGGAYQVLYKTGENFTRSYTVKLLDESLPYIGRLKVALKRAWSRQGCQPRKLLSGNHCLRSFTVSLHRPAFLRLRLD